MHQQFVMGCERCSRLIQFLPEEENKIIFAFAGCESEYLTLCFKGGEKEEHRELFGRDQFHVAG
jgi:hypothetical protein